MGKLNCCFLMISAVLFCFCTGQQPLRIPTTKFTCQGRASGYYADVDAGCQVYHMCDGLGRQFSYSCPNTTLFQQRMLVCDHWYMVNCTNSPSEYHANLLIGQRDKPFVSDHENHQRTPRPDILSVPYSNNYYDGLKEAETKYYKDPSNSIVGAVDTINPQSNDDLDDGSSHYAVPTHWSTHSGNQKSTNVQNSDLDKRHTIPTTTRSVSSQVGNIKTPKNNPSFQPTNSNHRQPNFNDQQINLNNEQSSFKNQQSTFNNQQSSFHNQQSNFNNQQSSFDNQQFNFNNQQSNSNARHTNTNNPGKNTENIQINFNHKETNFNQQTASALNSEEYPKIDIKTDFTRRPTGTGNIEQQSTVGYAGTTEKTISTFNNTFSTNTEIQFPNSNSNEQTEQHNINIAGASQGGVVDFIKRFNPTDASKSTSMTQAEILSINQELPKGSTNSEEDDNKSLNPDYETQVTLDTNNQLFTSKDNHDDIDRNVVVSKQPHSKPSVSVDRRKFDVPNESNKFGIKQISRELLPPKENYLDSPSSTMGPPIYYEWKWAAPAFNLQPPKEGNKKIDSSDLPKQDNVSTDFPIKGKLPVQTRNQVTQRSVNEQTSTQKTTEYQLGSYFVPDFTFPLDKAHPGYTEDDSQTSFRVRIPDNWKSGDIKTPYYGENERCPHCHPAHVLPGTCEPCIRR